MLIELILENTTSKEEDGVSDNFRSMPRPNPFDPEALVDPLK